MKTRTGPWEQSGEDVIEVLVDSRDRLLDIFLAFFVKVQDRLLDLLFVLLDDLSLTDQLLVPLAIHIEKCFDRGVDSLLEVISSVLKTLEKLVENVVVDVLEAVDGVGFAEVLFFVLDPGVLGAHFLEFIFGLGCSRFEVFELVFFLFQLCADLLDRGFELARSVLQVVDVLLHVVAVELFVL